MKIIDIIRCPKCKGELACRDGEGMACEHKSYFCPACGLTYPVIDGIIDFLPGFNVAKGRAQSLMESPRVVNVYESKWWRGCKFLKRFMGLTLAEEMALIKRIAKPGDNDTILDLACGTGIYTRSFALDGTGRNVVGLDVSWPMLHYAVNKAGQMGIKNVQFLHGDAHNLPFADGSLDVANCCGALHLFKDVRRVLGELYRALKPGGRLSVAAAWQSEKPWSRLKARLDERFWNVHYFSKEELTGLLDEAGFDPAIYHTYGIWIVAGGVKRI
jgi:SAM-dependent methyltransferase